MKKKFEFSVMLKEEGLTKHQVAYLSCVEDPQSVKGYLTMGRACVGINREAENLTEAMAWAIKWIRHVGLTPLNFYNLSCIDWEIETFGT